MASYTWNGSAKDGNYNNPANWTPNGVPGTTDTATISTTVATAINASNAAAGALTTNAHVTLNVSDDTSFTFGAGTAASTFSNGGTFALNSSNDATDLIVGGSKLTLSGAGTILLGNNGGNLIYGASAKDILVNSSNLIEGAGQLGDGSLTFSNGAAGTVDANQSNALVLNTGTITVSNAGLLEATSGASLVIESSVTDTGAGRIVATAGTVDLQSGATIQGGTLSSSAAGIINVAYSQVGTLSALTNKATVQVSDYGTLALAGTISNQSTIALQSTNDATELVIAAATVSLTGAGTILLDDNGGNYIFGAVATDTLNNVNNLISGAGHLGNGSLELINGAAGTISATGTNNALFLNTGSTLLNSGLIESTGPAGLIITNTLIDSSSGGTIFAASASTVSLQNGTSLEGGTVNTAGTGVVEVTYNETATLDGSAHTLTNLGTVVVQDYGTLSLLGTISNQSTIALSSTNDATELVIAAATVSLTGTGTILLDDNGGNYIFGAVATDTLNNVNNVISGAGHLGNAALTLINGAAGTISATGTSTALYLNTGSTLLNSGLIESTGPAGLIITNTLIDSSSGGTIFAASASTVSLQNGTSLEGGTVNTSGTGVVEVTYNETATLDGSAHTLTSLGSILVQDYGTLSLLGTISNQGTISLSSTNDYTELLTGPTGTTPGTVTLTGNGAIVLSNNGGNLIEGNIAGDTLINLNNTISGGGVIGGGQLVLTNDGTIDASVSTVLFLHTGNTITNNGLLEATAAGAGLIVQNDTISNTSGTILANNTSAFELQNGAAIDGGLVETQTGGVLAVTSNETGTLSGAAGAITLQGNVEATNYGNIDLVGSVVNDGTISLLSTNDATELVIASPTVTLTGGGSIVLSDNGGNYILGTTGTNVLDNVDNTISGGGHLGNGQLTLINAASGTIDANASNTLTLTTGNTVTNTGLIEATGPGGLVIQADTISNAGGTLLAASSAISLQNGATIAGGLIQTSNGGVVEVTYNETGNLSGLATPLTIKGAVQATDYGSLTLAGSIVNDGTISLLSTNDTTELVINSPTVTLTGSGSVVLSDNANNYIFSATGTNTLDNVNNTISGAGHLGDGHLTLVNALAGTIDATGTNALTLHTGNTVINNGLIEATGTGGLVVQSDTVQNGGLGKISALNSDIYLQGGATLAGGTINATGTGAVVVAYNTTGALDGTAHILTNLGSVSVNDYGTLTLLGTIANSGTISLNSSNDTTELLIGPTGTAAGTVTLTGGGVINTSNDAANYLIGSIPGDTLVNLNNTIEGSGNLGDGQLDLVNSGTIAATLSNALTLSVGANDTGLNTATGQLLAIGTGGLSVQNGTYTNAGLIQADDNSNVTFSSNATLTNDRAGTLTGGTYAALSTGDAATLSISGPALTTDAANLILSGTGAGHLLRRHRHPEQPHRDRRQVPAPAPRRRVLHNHPLDRQRRHYHAGRRHAGRQPAHRPLRLRPLRLRHACREFRQPRRHRRHRRRPRAHPYRQPRRPDQRQRHAHLQRRPRHAERNRPPDGERDHDDQPLQPRAGENPHFRQYVRHRRRRLDQRHRRLRQ